MLANLSVGQYNPKRARVALFGGIYASGATPKPQSWTKPKNATMIYCLAIGAGGGGGAGGAGGSNAGGGSGGISSTIGTLIISALACPPQLYAFVPLGGKGSTGSGATAGSISYISTTPNSQLPSACVLASSHDPAYAGIDGGTGSAGAAVTGNSAPTTSYLILGSLGAFSGTSGRNSGAGGLGAVGGNAGFLGGSVLTAGAGGGGSSAGGADFNGGNISNPRTTWLPNPILGGQAGGLIDGANGIQSLGLDGRYTPWLLFGGSGGASNAAGQGGRGGNGAIGCGGGGGGGGLTRGIGGDGGQGLVMIMWW